MGILTIILAAAVATSVYIFVRKRREEARPPVFLVKEIGIFALVFGVFAQFIALYEAFHAIGQVGTVSPALLMGGLKVSSITTLYGCVIFLLAWVLYFGLRSVKGAEER